MLVDGHAHVSDTEYGCVAALLTQLDQSGIERVLCVPGGTIDVTQFTRYLTGKLRPRQEIPNHLVYDAIDRFPNRCYGLVCINPHAGAAALDMMRDGFAHGCRGVKLSPQTHQFPFTEPVLMDVAAACGERGYPVYSHVLPSPGSTTADYAALARRCPKTNFILGHMGFGPGDADAIDFCADMNNFYLETSLGNYLIIRNALAKAGARKLIFGSEFPLGHPKAELENVRLLDPSAHEAVCGGNILRLIGVAPAAAATLGSPQAGGIATGTQMNPLFIYAPCPPNSLRHFVEFWAERYHDPHEVLYTHNIRGPHTSEGLGQLFKWKIGSRDFASKFPRLKRNFIDRLDEAERLLSELAACEPREIARRFLDRFGEGGAIYRVFWLHCWNTRFPIYDQHVHRAMTFIKDNGQMEELPKFKPERQIQLYLDRYLPFFDEFQDMDSRTVDQALWRFGKSLRDRSLPRLRSGSER